MLLDASIPGSVKKLDYLSLGLIMLYAVYAYRSLREGLDVQAVIGNQPGWPSLDLYLVPLAVFSLVFLSVARRQTTAEDWGLSYGKAHRRSLLFCAVIGLLLVVEGEAVPSLNTIGRLFPVLLTVAAGMIILGTRLASLVTSQLGTSRTSSVVTLVLASVVFLLIHLVCKPLGLKVVIVSVGLAGVLVGSRSVLILMIIGVFTIHKGLPSLEGSGWAALIIAVALYLALALPLRWLERRQQV